MHLVCRARHSCEQTPARYTSMRPSPVQGETAKASCTGRHQGRGCKRGSTTEEASSTDLRQGRDR